MSAPSREVPHADERMRLSQASSPDPGMISWPVWLPRVQRSARRADGSNGRRPHLSEQQESTTEPSMSIKALRMRPAWALLEQHYQTIKDLHLRQLFAEDPQRGER